MKRHAIASAIAGLVATFAGVPWSATAQELPPGHPPTPTAPSAPRLSEEELVKQLDATKGLKEKEKPFEAAFALGKLYYGRARYKEAAEYLDQAVAMAKPSRARPSFSGLNEAMSLLANARYILGETKAALAVRDRQLERFAGDPEALFARAAMRIDLEGNDLKALAKAKADLVRLMKENPRHPRAASAQRLAAHVDEVVAAGGTKKLAVKRSEVAKTAPVTAFAPATAPMQSPGGSQEVVVSPQMMEAIQNTEKTPELEAGFKKLLDEAEEHLARGQFQDALSKCARVVPFEPENSRAKSGMAWALVRLDKQPMADRVWSVAVSSDPMALDKLGDILKSKGDGEGAKRLWSKLAQSAPDYASKLSEKLK